jgi:hypothetical protein
VLSSATEQNVKTGTQIRLGVLITYHDEKSLLTECLASLMQATHQPD